MAVRIAGVVLPDQKRVEIALTRIYGIGRSASRSILEAAGVDPLLRCRELSERDTARIRETLDGQYRTEGELRREVLQHVRRLKEIGAYRGIRHARHLPARGQRTRTNSRTVRGNVRKTAGSGRRKAAEKK